MEGTVGSFRQVCVLQFLHAHYHQQTYSGFGNMKAVLYEVIYATALTTSQLGWKQGVEYAISKKCDAKNFIINWIDGLRNSHG